MSTTAYSRSIHGRNYTISQSLIPSQPSHIPLRIRALILLCMIPILYVVSVPLMILTLWKSVHRRIISILLPKQMNKMDRELKHVKLELFQGLKGCRILDIGAGAGQYLPYFHDAAHVTELEPNPHLRSAIEKSRKTLHKEYPEVEVDIVTGYVSDLLIRSPLDQYDVIVFGNVCCEFPNVQEILQQCNQLLVPGGRVIFIEHIRSNDMMLGLVQDCIAPLWRILADGCTCNKLTSNEFQKITTWDVNTWNLMLYDVKLFVQPFVVGICIKQS